MAWESALAGLGQMWLLPTAVEQRAGEIKEAASVARQAAEEIGNAPRWTLPGEMMMTAVNQACKAFTRAGSAHATMTNATAEQIGRYVSSVRAQETSASQSMAMGLCR